MSSPLLRSKLFIPLPPVDLVHRPRLTQIINEGLTRKLTLISAPAGFGKTTLLSEWIPNSRRAVTWLSLEEADNDPVRFWTYCMAALQMLQENLAQDAKVFLYSDEQRKNLGRLEHFLTLLINEVIQFSEDFVLVLDDYHQIKNHIILEGFIFLLDHLPPNMHIIITCRADPLLPLARLRARGQMVELRAEDLRFTYDEVAEFFNRMMKLNISAEQIGALEIRTEGWIAGLQLAAISMQKRPDTTSFISSFTGSHRFILDYLVNEVLACQPEEVQTFLLDTSLLERFTSSLCDAVTGRNDSRRMLQQLEQSNLFIVPLDHERRWYRYHHLFADLLRGRLQEQKPDQVYGFHQRACDWFEEEGLLPEAVKHAFAMKEYSRAAQLIEQAAEMQRQAGEIATLTDWLNAIPDSVRQHQPGLSLVYARALVDLAQHAAVETLISEAESVLQSDGLPDETRMSSLQGQIYALRAYLAMVRFEFDSTIELSRRAQTHFHENEKGWRSFVALNLAGAYRFTNYSSAACQTYLEAAELSLEAGDNVNALTALSMRGEVLQAQGYLHQSAQQFDQVLQLAGSLAVPNAPVTGYALIGLGRTRYEWNDLRASIQYVQDGIETGKKAELLDVLLRGYLVLARIRQVQGDFGGALEAVEQAETVARKIGTVMIKDWVNAQRTQIWLAHGEIKAAIGWAASIKGEIPDRIYPSIAITLAKVRILEDRPDEALKILEHAFQSAHAVNRLGNAIQILAVTAIVHRARGHPSLANSTLLEALTLAEPEGYIRTFLDEGEPIRMMISDLRFQLEKPKRTVPINNQKTLKDYVHKLLAEFTLSPAPYPGKSIMHDQTPTILEPLSERELEVLRLMVAGLSNREIAELDVVSINTVKTQVKNIFGKLGVHRREEAIAAAHELHML